MSMIGKTLAHYQITAEIGKGGMGEVYQATDTKLGRDVAIKVLPEEFAKDADRVARFQREAKLLASLNHPNIAAIHGLEAAEGTHFLVLELVEGQTLAERIKGGPIPVEEALELGLQIAEALEAAHEKGVIHRDLKPANIKVTPEGKVKVLDFGLAKAYAGDPANINLSNSPTLSDMATQQGVILGTAAYMPPEQAKGKTVDTRADVWAFGVVIFEMLTGRQLFTGETVSETLASVIKSEPEWSSLPPNLHPRIRLMLERCLEKEPKNRYGAVNDARVDIERVLADPGGVYAQPVAATGEAKAKSKQILMWAAAIVVLLAIVGIIAWEIKEPDIKQVLRADFELPADQQLSTYPFPFNISPDGKHIVYGTQKGLYLRSMDELNAKPIAGVDGMPESPFFSPDGKSIVFGSPSDRKLKKIAIGGGAPVNLCDLGPVRGISWLEDDYIVFGTFDRRIMRVSSKGGDPKILFELKAGIPVLPMILPDKNLLIYTDEGMDGSQAIIMAKPLDSEEAMQLFPGWFVRYLPSKHIIYLDSENNLCAVPFDLDSLQAIGEHVPLITGVDEVAVSDSGSLIYTLTRYQEESAKQTLVWVDKAGNETPLEAPPNDYYSIKISPDGKRVAFVESDSSVQPIFILDILRGIPKKLTLDVARALQPIWIPSGEKIIYWAPDENSPVGSIFWRPADGSGQIQKITSDPNRQLLPWSISHDGKTLLMQELVSFTNADIGALSMEGDYKRRLLLQKEYSEAQPAISPDGQLLAYVSSESTGEVEQSELFICSYPEVDNFKDQVSRGGGVCPLWSPDGKELYYLTPNNDVMVVSVKTEPSIELSPPERLFHSNNTGFIFGRGYPWDIHPDGNRFLMIRPPAGSDTAPAVFGPREITIVMNWIEELKKLAPAD